jgi:hypothetical protein
VFAFDNSSGHACKANDALVANRLGPQLSERDPKMYDATKEDGIKQAWYSKRIQTGYGSPSPRS